MIRTLIIVAALYASAAALAADWTPAERRENHRIVHTFLAPFARCTMRDGVITEWYGPGVQPTEAEIDQARPLYRRRRDELSLREKIKQGVPVKRNLWTVRYVEAHAVGDGQARSTAAQKLQELRSVERMDVTTLEVLEVPAILTEP